MLDKKCVQHVGGLQCLGPSTLFTDVSVATLGCCSRNLQSWFVRVSRGFHLNHFPDMPYSMLSTHRSHEAQGLLSRKDNYKATDV